MYFTPQKYTYLAKSHAKHERKRYHVQKDNLKLLLTPKSVDSSLFLFEDGGDVKGIMLQFEGLV